MTDKQIIDEERMFECVWCKYDFKESEANFILSENPNECVCSGCITEWADNLLYDLKRKEQECETLASQLDFEVQKKECLEQECEELKKNYFTVIQQRNKAEKILTEIKEIAEINPINTCWTVLELCEKCDENKECDIQCPLFKFKLILQKISECEVER